MISTNRKPALATMPRGLAAELQRMSFEELADLPAEKIEQLSDADMKQLSDDQLFILACRISYLNTQAGLRVD